MRTFSVFLMGHHYSIDFLWKVTSCIVAPLVTDVIVVTDVTNYGQCKNVSCVKLQRIPVARILTYHHP